MTPEKIIVATTNDGKIREIKKLFEGTGIELHSLKDVGWVGEIVEDGNSFAENAEIKARAVFNKFNSPVLAEDSGLVVEPLNGDPGIFSARYAGEGCTDRMNNEKLLANLKNIEGKISAAFVCSAVYMDSSQVLKADGKVVGRITKEPRGVNGFGYDPLFIPDGFDKTSAELDPEIKNSISHRGKAIKEIRKLLVSE